MGYEKMKGKERYMRRTEHYKNSIVDALARERTDGQGWTAEVCVMQNDTDTLFF